MDPAEDAMRTQMFKTMVALEKMCDAVTDFLGQDGAQWPAAGAVKIVEEQEIPKATTGDELKSLGRIVAKHHQALGLVATFAEMRNIPAFGTQPARAIADLLGMKACDECVGTGWIARDETCAKCGRTGYLKV